MLAGPKKEMGFRPRGRSEHQIGLKGLGVTVDAGRTGSVLRERKENSQNQQEDVHEEGREKLSAPVG